MQLRAPVSRIINTAVCLHEQSQSRDSHSTRVSDRFLASAIDCETWNIRRYSPNVKHLDPKSIKADVRYVREIVRRVGKDRWVIKDRQGIVEYSVLPCLWWMRNLPNVTARKYTMPLQQTVMISRVCSLERILVVSVALLGVWDSPYKVALNSTPYRNGKQKRRYYIYFLAEVQSLRKF